MRLTLILALSLTLSACIGAIVSDGEGTRVITPVGTSDMSDDDASY